MPSPYSHPPEDGRDGVLLADHLDDIAERVEYVTADDATTPGGESLAAVVESLAYVHDFGKATTYFQQYIGQREGSPPDDRHRHHAPIGSFAAYYVLDEQGFDEETCLAGFVAVAKHHGRLPDVAEYVHNRTHRRDDLSGKRQSPEEQQQTVIWEQIQDIDDDCPDLARAVFEDASHGDGDWASFRDGFVSLLADIEETVAMNGRVPGPREDALSETCYALVLQCWSALVLADKTSAARTPNNEATYAADPPSTTRLTEYVEDIEADASADPDGTRGERLNHYRSRAREDVLDTAVTFAEEGGGVATLTLPTGMGKTLTGLSAALEIRDRLGGERVVYALPFTSIIDQVVDEIEDIYRTDSTGRVLTAHHHLAETVIRDDGNDSDADEADQDDDVEGMLAESWRAGLTVTTFVQLFESLAGPRNRQSMKLPALRDSVVILDEPQSLPLDWWKLVPRLVDVLTEQYGATVIAMTATQPELFDDATGLTTDPEEYFEAVERVSYELDPSTERYIADQSGPKSYDDAAATLEDAVGSGRSTLAVCNTIDSARELTDRVDGPDTLDVGALYESELRDRARATNVEPEDLVDRIQSANGRPLIHLSTRLRPVDRLTLIETAKRLTERETPVLVVSTQLVEAGVDISFDRVYRDLAPIDSIVQAAGRCNRSFERERGTVTVWWLGAPEDQQKTPAEAVYNRGTTLLPLVAETLQRVRDESGGLTETDVARTSVRRYFDRLRNDKDVGKQEYVDFVDRANADELGELSLIDQRRSAEVVVARTDEDRKLLERIREAQAEYDYAKLDGLLEETKPLQISVPYYREDSDRADAIRELHPLVEDQGIYELDTREQSAKFDPTKGFVVPESSVDHQFL